MHMTVNINTIVTEHGYTGVYYEHHALHDCMHASFSVQVKHPIDLFGNFGVQNQIDRVDLTSHFKVIKSSKPMHRIHVYR